MDKRVREYIRKNHLYSSESDLHKIIEKEKQTLDSDKVSLQTLLKPLYPKYRENNVLEFIVKNGIYSDESCLEKITSNQYKVAFGCKETREREQRDLQKRLVRRQK